MATNYPSSLDNSTTIPVEAASTPLATNHVTAHQNIQDALEAIEAKVGVDSSAVTTSHDYKLGEVTSTDKAVGKTATQTLTNKTLTAPTITGATVTTSTVNGVTLQTGGSATDFLAASGSYVSGSVANASTTVAGVSEEATSAEVTSGASTGGTGAKLFITPAALAASTPVFDGSGITNVSKLLTSSASDTTFNNSSAENTLVTYSLAGGTLGTSKVVKVKALIDYVITTANVNCTFRVKYGGTTIASFGTSGVTGTPSFTATFAVDFSLIAAGSTSSQEGFVLYTQTGTSFSPIAGALKGSSSIDSTTSQNITITAQMDTAAASATSAVRMYFIEKCL
jgi:hypothetical protein